MAGQSETQDLLGDLWDLVEEWSSSAIQRARDAANTGASEVADAEIRVAIAHAAELRAVIDRHAVDVEEPAPAVDEAPAGDAEAVEAPAAELPPAPTHICNSADFDRPRCEACGGLHWFCSICGAQRDECRAATA